MLEEAEETWFRDQFAEWNALGRLDWPAMVERSEPIRVHIYDPADRERFLAGDAIATWDIVKTNKKPRISYVDVRKDKK